MNNRRSGQSTLEYVIILAVVVGAIILVGMSLKTNVKTSYETLGTNMQNKITGMVTP